MVSKHAQEVIDELQERYPGIEWLYLEEGVVAGKLQMESLPEEATIYVQLVGSLYSVTTSSPNTASVSDSAGDAHLAVLGSMAEYVRQNRQEE